MKRSEIKILLVEDDQNLGKALYEGLKRLNYSVRWATSPEEGLNQFRISEPDLVILDCLLPKKNGVELALEMRNYTGSGFKIIFTSGIFKDKSFIQDAIQQTGAVAFLTKPFDFEALNNQLSTCFADELEEEDSPLTQLHFKDSVSSKEIKTALAKTSSLHGFELPWIYSLLHHGKFSGKMDVIPVDRELSTIVFSEGKVTDVVLKDSESYFGVLLVEMGFTSPEEVEQSLSSQGGKPIGQLLIDASALSPHAVNIVRTEQLAIRLSKTIQDTPVEIQLTEEAVESGPAHLGQKELSIAFHDWVSSKISRSWLMQFYTQWLDTPLQISSSTERLQRVKDFPVLTLHAEVLAKINGKLTLQNLVDLDPKRDRELFEAVHFGVLEKIFYFAPKVRAANDYKEMTQRLNRLAGGLDKKNHFEVLGLTQKANAREISKAYLDLAKVFHPDKMDSSAPAALKKLNEQVFTRMTQAYDELKDDYKRDQYLKHLSMGDASLAIEIENQIERCRRMLSLGQYSQTAEVLKPYLEAKHNPGQVKTLYLWSQIKCLGSRMANSKEVSDFQSLMNQIPPEDRHSSVFFYVKGIFYKAIGDHKKAYTHFRNSVAVDPSMGDAKRELLILAKEQKEKQDSTDWSKKVSRFFSGESKKRRRSG